MTGLTWCFVRIRVGYGGAWWTRMQIDAYTDVRRPLCTRVAPRPVGAGIVKCQAPKMHGPGSRVRPEMLGC